MTLSKCDENSSFSVVLYLWSFNQPPMKKMVPTVSGWFFPLNHSYFPESHLCFTAWEKEDLDPWPRTHTTGFLWVEQAFPEVLRYTDYRRGLGSQHPEVTEEKKAGSWNNIPGNPRIEKVWYLISDPYRAAPKEQSVIVIVLLLRTTRTIN